MTEYVLLICVHVLGGSFVREYHSINSQEWSPLCVVAGKAVF